MNVFEEGKVAASRAYVWTKEHKKDLALGAGGLGVALVAWAVVDLMDAQPIQWATNWPSWQEIVGPGGGDELREFLSKIINFSAEHLRTGYTSVRQDVAAATASCQTVDAFAFLRANQNANVVIQPIKDGHLVEEGVNVIFHGPDFGVGIKHFEVPLCGGGVEGAKVTVEQTGIMDKVETIVFQR